MPWVGQAAECGGGNNTYIKNLSKEEGFTKKSLSLKNVLYCFTPNTASSWIWIYAYHYQGLLRLDYCKWALLRQTMARLSTVIWSWNKHFETSVLELKYGLELGYWLQLRGRGKTQKVLLYQAQRLGLILAWAQVHHHNKTFALLAMKSSFILLERLEHIFWIF